MISWITDKTDLANGDLLDSSNDFVRARTQKGLTTFQRADSMWFHQDGSALNKEFTDLGFVHSISAKYGWDVFTHEEGLVQITGHAYHAWLSEALIEPFEKIVKKYKKEMPKRELKMELGSVHMLMKDRGSFYFMEIREQGVPLLPENYDPKAVEQYKRVITEFPSTSPAGRLCIMNGPPGGGKSYMVRALLHDLRESCMFVLVPPSMLTELSKPELIPTLIQQQLMPRNKNRPMILVLEDADSCLLKREKGQADVSALSTLLNFSDGIFGSALNLRIVATTNADSLSIDTAALREGRLLEHIQLSELDVKHCNGILKRLVPTAKYTYETKKCLNEIYTKARELGWTPPKIEVKVEETKKAPSIWDILDGNNEQT